MGDLEKVEMAIRRVLSHIQIQPHGTDVETILQMLADELAEMSRPSWEPEPVTKRVDP